MPAACTAESARSICSYGPEVLILRPVDLVQFQPRMCRVHLQVDRCGLDRLLLVGQLREAVGESVAMRNCIPTTPYHSRDPAA